MIPLRCVINGPYSLFTITQINLSDKKDVKDMNETKMKPSIKAKNTERHTGKIEYV